MKEAVQVVILNDNGEVLAVSRKEDHNDFGLVGGKVDEGETPIQAILRETLEEREIEVQDYYLDRALKTLGYSSFPYPGLNDKGMNVLIGRAIELQEDE